MNLSPASTQKSEDRPISFILDDQLGGALQSIDFFIRPEELTRTHPSRVSVNQTLGGAWIDSFGEGLETTTISGTLGWRTGPDGLDGGARLLAMREQTYDQWHSRRATAISVGSDPNQVQLLFVDTLNDYARVIVPQVFEIRRSKSRPLLANYRISFVAVSKAQIELSTSIAGLLGADPSGFGLDSLFGSIDKINGAINSVTKFVDQTILAPVQSFMRLTSKVLTSVHSVIQSGSTLAGSLVNVASSLTQSGMNIFRTFAAVAGIPSTVKSLFMGVASAFSNSFCILHNALRSLPTYEDYNNLFGASNCSSTSGGTPPSQYANANPFFSVAPQSSGSIGVSQPASISLGVLAKSDVSFTPLSTLAIGGALSNINAGVRFA